MSECGVDKAEISGAAARSPHVPKGQDFLLLMRGNLGQAERGAVLFILCNLGPGAQMGGGRESSTAPRKDGQLSGGQPLAEGRLSLHELPGLPVSDDDL